MKHRLRLELSICEAQDGRTTPGFGVQEILDFVDQEKPVLELLTSNRTVEFTEKAYDILDKALTEICSEYSKLK